jgi:hypothetical protein
LLYTIFPRPVCTSYSHCPEYSPKEDLRIPKVIKRVTFAVFVAINKIPLVTKVFADELSVAIGQIVLKIALEESSIMILNSALAVLLIVGIFTFEGVSILMNNCDIVATQEPIVPCSLYVNLSSEQIIMSLSTPQIILPFTLIDLSGLFVLILTLPMLLTLLNFT